MNMKKKFYTQIMLISLLALAFLLAAPAAFAQPLPSDPTAVSGRVLSAFNAGDTSDWVEIAQYDGYSLITRKDCLMDIGKIAFADVETDSYAISKVRQTVNNWFINTLPATAKLRDYTVANSAAADVGYFANINYGLSIPSATAIRSGTDVAFLLSFAEAARFCSLKYATGATTVTDSPALARSNFELINEPAQEYMQDFWWLRSPGHSGQVKTGASVGSHTPGGYLSRGTVYASSSRAAYPYVRPALWVKSAIFEGGGSNSYTLTYNANGGSGAPAPQTAPPNSYINLSATVPLRANYTFLGWATSASVTLPQYQPGASIFLGSNITLYAVWKDSQPATGDVEGVDGRILTPDKSGDKVNWIEIARYGGYSLIVRSSYLNIYPQDIRKDYPEWQFTPYNSGATISYATSTVRDKINAWFSGNLTSPLDTLPSGAKMRQYTMQNNALSVPGTASTTAGLTNGFSKPSNTKLPTGNDVAFALSYSEVANFCSNERFRRGANPETEPSNNIAKANFAKLHRPDSTATHNFGAWLRSPGDFNGTAGALSFSRGTAFQFHSTNAISNECGLLYPALWVDSDIFMETRTVTGLVWPLAVDDLGIPGFLDMHKVTIELRTTFLTPAPPALRTTATLLNNDALGSFTFEKVPLGTYILHISRPGFLTRAMPVIISESSPQTISLVPPSTHENNIFVLWWGDCTDDLIIDAKDRMMLMQLMPYHIDAYMDTYIASCDLNADGNIDGQDLMALDEMLGRMIFDYPGAEFIDIYN